jgi:pimeloyl-ACP methyl ester carboxylesterase
LSLQSTGYAGAVDWTPALSLGRRMLGGARTSAGEAWSVGRALAGYRRRLPGLIETTTPWERGAGFATPVALVHGAAHNHTAWGTLHRRRAAGFERLVALEYDVGAPIEELAGELGERVVEVAARADTDRVHLVGHSLGGFALRVWHDLFGGDAWAASAVTLGSPHRPFPFARLPWSPPPVRQLAPGSALHQRLASSPVDHAAWTTIAGGFDQLVRPRYATVDGAQAVVVRHLGHLGLLYSRTAAGLVCFSLLAAEEAAAAAEVA